MAEGALSGIAPIVFDFIWTCRRPRRGGMRYADCSVPLDPLDDDPNADAEADDILALRLADLGSGGGAGGFGFFLVGDDDAGTTTGKGGVIVSSINAKASMTCHDRYVCVWGGGEKLRT